MITRPLAVVLLLFAGIASAADWRASLPAGWLVAIEAKDLATLEAGAAKLMTPWGRKVPPISKSLAAMLPNVEVAERPWGFALVVGKERSPNPVAYLPTDDFDALCDALNADRADSVAVANVSGYDLALTDLDGWVQVSLLDGLPPGGVDQVKSQRPSAWAVEGDVRAIVSRAGLQRIADELKQRRQGQLAEGKGRIGSWRWPHGYDAYVDQMAPYAPLAQELASWDKPLEVGCEFVDETIRVAADMPVAIKVRYGVAPQKYETSGDEIGYAVLPRGLPDKFIDLAIAWMRCRPDEIDAPDYPQPEWDDLAEAYRGLLSHYRSLAMLQRLPVKGEPVATNDMAVFVWDDDAASLGDALQLMTLRWNQLIDASEARAPLRLELAPLEESEGWRISTDLFKGFGLERSPEVEEVFNRYYGGDVLAINITRSAESNEWLVSYGKPNFELLKAVPTEADAEAPVLIESELRLDRWFAWKAMIDAIEKAGTLGYRPREPMAEAPAATLRVTGGASLRIESSLPLTAYENAITHWRSNEVAK